MLPGAARDNDVDRLGVVRDGSEGVALDDDLVAKRLTFSDTLPAEMTSSMAGDLKRGNRLELDWLSGAVVRLGSDLGVPTPANAFVTAALTLHADGQI